MLKQFKNLRYALAGMLLLFCAAVQAQTVSGNVKDSNGEPIIGATIMEQGTKNGTVTDFDGNFTIKLQKAGDLNISYIGMQSQTVKTAGKSSVAVTLKDDNTTLNDVVVVGYGTMKRKDLTGSVSSVTGDKLTENPVANVAEALQGKMGGVNVMVQDGRPGGEAAIRVRGGGSITQSNDPLFIVDGIAVSGIDDIPADQIESIDVLKDASSTAIYGARGANGVILVTTKQAKEGKTQIKYNMYYQVKAYPQTLDIQDAYTAVRKTWEYNMASGPTAGSYGDMIAKYYGLGSANGNHLNDYKNVTAYNHLDDILQTGSMWNHDLSLSGGTDKTKYYAALNYTNDGSTQKNSGYSRWNVNLKLQQKLAKTLTLDINAKYSETKTQQNRYYSGSHANNTLIYPNTYASIDTETIKAIGGDGDLSNLGEGANYSESFYNPSAVVADNDYVKKQQTIRMNTSLTWTPIKGLTAKSELGLSRHWSKTQQWQGRETGKNHGTSQATLSQGDGYNLSWTNTLNYDFSNIIKSDDHKLNFLLGHEMLASKSNSSKIVGTKFAEGWGEDEAFGQIQMAQDHNQSYGSNTIGTPSKTLSFFGRMNYNLLSRYMFTFTLRADGSSKFADGHRWGWFPAGAVAWRITDEPWMKGAASWLDNLKLRLSIGTSGNDGIDASAFVDTWTSTQSTQDGTFSYKTGEIKGNPNLTWEKTTSRNAGIDYSFLNGKFNGSVDLYWNTTSDCLMLVPINPAYGFSYQYQNVAQTSNKGVEFAFNYNIIDKKDWKLSFGLTYNYNVNNVDEVTSANLGVGPTYASSKLYPSDCYKVLQGEPVGVIQGFVADGYYTVDDFNVVDGVWILKDGVADASTKLSNYYGNTLYSRPKTADGKNYTQNAFPGMPKFKDVNEDGTVDENDQTIIGRMSPRHTGGFNFSGRWKSLDFNMNFTYQLDGKVYNGNLARAQYSGGANKWASTTRLASKFDNSWSMFDIDSNGDLYLITDPAELAAHNAGVEYGLLAYSEEAIVSSDYIESAAYLRLQSITIGYTFPKKWVNKIGMSNARIYFTGGNLFCISGYSGLDPDVNTDSAMSSTFSGFPTPGYDYNAYPRSRTFTFGLNVAF